MSMMIAEVSTINVQRVDKKLTNSTWPIYMSVDKDIFYAISLENPNAAFFVSY